MAKGQDNGTTILLRLKDYKVGEVWGGEEKVVVKTEVKGRIRCPHCGSGRLLAREIDEEALGFIQDEDEIYLGIEIRISVKKLNIIDKDGRWKLIGDVFILFPKDTAYFWKFCLRFS